MTVAALVERSRRDREAWKYTDLEALLARQAPARARRQSRADTNDHPRFVFVNGVFQAKQSHFGAVPSCILMGDVHNGYHLVLGEHTCLVAQPIEFIFTADEDAPQEIAIKLAITVGANGRLSLLENHQTSPAVTVLETEITLHAYAKFAHGKIIHSGGAHLARTTVSVAKGGYYNNFSLIRGTQLTRNEIDVTLQDKQAQATLNGVMLLRDSEHADTATRIAHAAPHCASRQIYKTVLDGKARGVFQGKIIVAKDAQKSDGYQLSRALLLSDQAEMDAKPELEIYADDVKCSHGSAIGDLDEQALFYLRSRGLSEAEARALLIHAFVAEMLDAVESADWRAAFRVEIERWAR